MSSTKTQTARILVSDVMSYNVVAVQEEDAVSTAVRNLLNRGVGSVLVMGKEDQVAGIITKGDILREIVAKNADPRKIISKDIMSHPIVTINYDQTVEEASKLMIQKRVSKLAVLKDGKLAGIITATDIIREQPIQVEYLQELIRARFVPRDLR